MYLVLIWDLCPHSCVGVVREGMKWADGKLVKKAVEDQVS